MIENGIIKIKTVGGVTYGITHDDLRHTFGVAGSNMGAILQTAQVSPFAKFKPTRCGGFHPANWWKGEQKSVNGSVGYSYGLGFVDYDTIADLKTGSNGLGWTYEKPRGKSGGPNGEDEWYVRRDFDGYYHAAASPFYRVGVEGDTYQTIDQQTIYLQVDFTRNDGSLGAADFDIFDNWFFGFAIYGGGNNSLIGVGTSSTAFGQHTTAACGVTVEIPPRAVGTCYLYPFLSYNNFAWRETAPTGTQKFVPLPCGMEAITVVAGGPLGGLTFTFDSGGSINYVPSNGRATIAFPRLAVANSTASQKSLNKANIYMELSLVKTSDNSTTWSSGLINMGLSGLVTVAGNSSNTEVFDAVSKVMNNPSGTAQIAGSTSVMNLFDFVGQGGGTWSDYRHFAAVYYYYDTAYDDYHFMQNFEY